MINIEKVMILLAKPFLFQRNVFLRFKNIIVLPIFIRMRSFIFCLKGNGISMKKKTKCINLSIKGDATSTETDKTVVL